MALRAFFATSSALALLLVASSAFAQGAPPPGQAGQQVPPPQQPPPGYGQPPPSNPSPSGGYAQPYGQPPQPGYGAPYGNSGYSQGYGYNDPPPGPPPPPPRERKEPECCRYAIRYDPFDLISRRVTFQGEVGIIGPLAIEIEPSYIWGDPAGVFADGESLLDASGFAIAANVALYVSGRYLEGFFVKGHFAFETFEATLTHPTTNNTGTEKASAPILGLMIGSSNIWGNDDVGFNLSGGIGIGAALADKVTLTAPGDAQTPDVTITYYGDDDVIRLIGSLGLGVAF